MTLECVSLNNSTLSGDLGHKYDQIPPTVLGKLYEEAQIAGMSLDDYLKAKKMILNHENPSGKIHQISSLRVQVNLQFEYLF